MERITVTVEDGIADVRLNRPDKLNALDLGMLDEIVAAGAALAGDRSVRAVVLSGEGRGFCAGLDMAVLQTVGAGQGTDVIARIGATDGRITHLAQQAAWCWTEVPVPVIAALHGPVLGGGLQIALGTDIRIVAPDASLGVLEITWGFVPDMTGTLMLPRLVGPDAAKELVFTGRKISGAEAVTLGLATRVSDDPRGDALALAREIAGHNPDAIRAAKRLLDSAGRLSPAEHFAAERAAMATVLGLNWRQ